MKVDSVQDIYELSPVQKGILFHSLYTPETGFYFIQFSYKIHGDLDIVAFEHAWQQLTNRHTILRTSFYWEDIEKPLQVVHRQVKVPIEQYDWRGVTPAEQQNRLYAFLKSDRQRCFDFSKAPLMRVTLIRLADHSYQLVWSKHHLIIDGWSGSLVMREVFQLYQAFCNSQDLSLPPAIPFKNYISWLRKQDISKAKFYWQKLLGEVRKPTPLTCLKSTSSGQEERFDEEQAKISAATTAQLQSLAQQHRLTLNTLFQGAWALLLSRYSCQSQVVYGCGVSGRPVDLKGAESMVGVFINTLPIFVDVDPEQCLLPWLKQLQAQLVETRQYEYSPLVEIQNWSKLQPGFPLFDSIVVFENYPMPEISEKDKKELEVQQFTAFYKTNYALNVIGYPGPELMLGVNYDCGRFDSTTITSILKHFEILLQGMAANPEARLKDLSLLTPERQQFTLKMLKEMTFNFNLASCN
ncbi:condensation domain-containing protein [Leptothoe sp. EHU-05/26/07-4]